MLDRAGTAILRNFPARRVSNIGMASQARMKRWIGSSLLLIAAVSSGLAFARHCPGCIDRSRVNKACEWTGDAAFPIDWNNPAHQQHLIADAQLAEDLAIRHADAEFNRLYGYEAHGGLIDHGRVMNECMARLFGLIETNHAITPGQIVMARGQRSRVFDAVAASSFVPLYLFGSIVACSRLHRRFSADRRSVRLFAIGLTSVIAAFLGLQLGQLWLSVWETVRVRNGHMSPFRGASYTTWTHQHVGALFFAGVIIFWLAAIRSRHATLRNLARSAAVLVGAMLAAMFTDVFVQQAIGYILIIAVMVAFHRFVLLLERAADTPESQGILLP